MLSFTIKLLLSFSFVEKNYDIDEKFLICLVIKSPIRFTLIYVNKKNQKSFSHDRINNQKVVEDCITKLKIET